MFYRGFSQNGHKWTDAEWADLWKWFEMGNRQIQNTYERTSCLFSKTQYRLTKEAGTLFRASNQEEITTNLKTIKIFEHMICKSMNFFIDSIYFESQ